MLSSCIIFYDEGTDVFLLFVDVVVCVERCYCFFDGFVGIASVGEVLEKLVV